MSTQVFMFFNKELIEGSLIRDFCGSNKSTSCELVARARSSCSAALYKGMCLAISKTKTKKQIKII